MRKALRRAIVRAAPTCTLWRPMLDANALEFILWPKFRISEIELFEAIG